MELKGKNVFITGSTRGIGLAMAKTIVEKNNGEISVSNTN